jgi:hypothetical protein
LEWPYLTYVGFGSKSGFRKNAGRCQTEYSKGTAVARVWFGVLVGYYRGIGDGHVGLNWFYKWTWSYLIDLVYEQKGVSPFLEILLKLVF